MRRRKASSPATDRTVNEARTSDSCCGRQYRRKAIIQPARGQGPSKVRSGALRLSVADGQTTVRFIAVRITPSLKALIDQRAITDHRTAASVIELALIAYLGEPQKTAAKPKRTPRR